MRGRRAPEVMIVAPYFDELAVGMVFDDPPALTLTSGHAAIHQALLGDRLRLALDAGLSRRVLGSSAPLAHPGLVWDVAIGQSTVVTQRVIANLFYRGLVVHRAPLIGDTLHTSVEVAALRQNRPHAVRGATGLAALRVRTRDQDERRVLDFWRCAMLPLRDPQGETGHSDDLAEIGLAGDPPALGLAAAVAGWDLTVFRDAVPGEHFQALSAPRRWEVLGGDVISAAPELARLTLNVAFAHHDRTVSADDRRLVYGGHAIGLVCSHITRAIPNLVTVVAWHSCDHVGPLYEGDTLRTTLELERLEPLAGGGGLLHLRARAEAVGRDDGTNGEVLDWRLAAVLA
jgi:acyl dehydratase